MKVMSNLSNYKSVMLTKIAHMQIVLSYVIVAPTMTLEAAQPSYGVSPSRSNELEPRPMPVEEAIQVVEVNHTESAPTTVRVV